ncbi:hypothetical protein [Streptomyces sp. NRRL S-1448]|uniref:hypothetical protein n=1 Tax=Streptomyces sp. NRRL S-1448 TaxID=1463883 RepID=UPI001F358426|nr:hypothetical protein [Streptomyces sp. NRRL S-1448]
MPSCIHCGAHFEDSSAARCARCGMPHQGGVPGGTGQPVGTTRYGYVRVGPTILPQWLLWLVAALLAAGGVTVYVLLHSSSSETSQQTVDTLSSATPSPGSDPYSVPPTDPYSEPPTDPYSVPPTDLYSLPPTDLSTPTATETTASPVEDASATVREFYQAINDREFSAAWELGGKNIGGSSYSSWVAGYDTTVSILLSAVNTDSPGKASAVLYATQRDGSVKEFRGTYTVSDGVIVSADISEQ